MMNSRDIEFYASILNSLVHRRPFFLGTNGRHTDRLLKHVLSFVPVHRYLLVAGTIPRWARFLAGQPRELNSADPEDLTAALVATFEEERMGRRPVQLVYFGTGPVVYEKVLKNLPASWIATTDDRDWLKDLETIVPDCHELEGPEGLVAVHVGPRPMSMQFEKRLLERARDRHQSFATYLVQMKFTQLHLAGAAVLGEWEERAHVMTSVDLEEDFELDSLSTQTMIELAQADLGLDVGRCLKLADSRVIRIAENLGRIDYVNAVAVVEDRNVVWVKRIASTDINISCMASDMARFMDAGFDELGFGKLAHVWVSSSSGHQFAAMKDAGCAYMIFLGPEAKPALTLAAFSQELGQ